VHRNTAGKKSSEELAVAAFLKNVLLFMWLKYCRKVEKSKSRKKKLVVWNIYLGVAVVVVGYKP